jgi:hypothetical protein
MMSFPFDVNKLANCKLNRCNCSGCPECTKPYDTEPFIEQCGYCAANAQSKSWNYTISGRTLCVACWTHWDQNAVKPPRPTPEEKNYIFVLRKAFINWTIDVPTQTFRPDNFDYETGTFVDSMVEGPVLMLEGPNVPHTGVAPPMPTMIEPFNHHALHSAIIALRHVVEELRDRLARVEDVLFDRQSH